MKAKLVVGAVAVAGALALPTACGPAPLTCTASVSTSSPHQYSTIYVYTRTQASSRVTTVAHYKTTNTTKVVYANTSGLATTPYYIASATLGYRVNISVTVVNGSQQGSCSTYFTPQ